MSPSGGELAALVTRFEAGDPTERSATFYDLLALSGGLGQTAASAQARIEAANEARELAENTLAAERHMCHERLGAAAAENARVAAELVAARDKTRQLERNLR